MIREPFYPCQTTSGETYVVDGRSGKIVSTVFCSFDTAQRWHIAKLRARNMNDDHVLKLFVRRRMRLAWLALALSLIALYALAKTLI